MTSYPAPFGAARIKATSLGLQDRVRRLESRTASIDSGWPLAVLPGVIDPGYVSGSPMVLVNGSPVLTGPYQTAAGYAPTAGDAVWVLPVGAQQTYIVLGKTSSGGGGGGAGGLQRMPWNVLGGWTGSTFDPSTIASSNPYPNGFIFAAAVVADTTAPFSRIVTYVANVHQVGTGALFTVTDAAGNHLASATNADTVMATGDNDFYDLTLNTTVTPSAAQQVFHVAFLFPASVTTLPNLGSGAGGNHYFLSGDSPVTYPSWGDTGTTGNTSIPDPLPALTEANTALPAFFALR